MATKHIFHWSKMDLGLDTVKVAQRMKLGSCFQGHRESLKAHKTQDRTLAQKLRPTMRLEQ